MKKRILSALAVIIGLGLQAANVNSDVTRTVAANFWNTYRSSDCKPVSASELTFVDNQQWPYLHIYAVSDQGFIIVSADDCARPVPAYSFESQFPEEMNPEMRYWLDSYNGQIAYAVAEHATATAATMAEWNSILTATVPDAPMPMVAIPTMLTTKWNQTDPYNRLCPYDTVEHARSVVGCVATAMAQVMKYWNHPSCGTGSHSYEPSSDGGYASYSYGILTADFANTTYMWGSMPNSLTLVANNQQVNAVATLSYHCGVAVEMMYSPDASGAWTISYGDSWRPCAERALREFFRYSPDLHGEQRWHYNDSVWTAMLNADLNAGIPILYTGSDQGGGHAFVFDGADTNGRYHINLGWGGYGDGYYTINNIAPNGGGTGSNNTNTFNHNQTATFGIVPVPQSFDTVDYYDTVCATDATYHFYDYSIPAIAGDYTLIHLDTVYNIHLSSVQRRYAYYDPNGGEGTTRSTRYCPNRGAVMAENTFVREGHYFRGWCRDVLGDDILYQPGDTVHITTNCFFYAIWGSNGDTLGINGAGQTSLALRPNPVANELTVTIGTAADVTIIDALGHTVTTHKLKAGESKINMSGLPRGMYFVRVSTNSGVTNHRIIKR